MKALEITSTKYSCDKCFKTYSRKSACVKHEALCKKLSNYDTLITHDGLYTYPSKNDTLLEFVRKSYVYWSLPDFPVRLYFDPQSTINAKIERTTYHSPFGDNLVENNTNYYNSARDLFSWSENRENLILVDSSLLLRFAIEIYYSNGDIKKLNKKDEVRYSPYNYVSFKIFENNPIVEIKVTDIIKPKEKTIVSHKLDFNVSRYEVFSKPDSVLLKLSEFGYSSSEHLTRVFIKNTKVDTSELPKYFRLEGNRVAHNTDDWLDINGKIHHFQGSSYEGVRKGLFQYHGNTLEECLLTREFFKLKRITWDVGFGFNWDRHLCFEFYIGDTKFRFKGNLNSYNPKPKPYNYYKVGDNDDTEISALELYKLLLKFDGNITEIIYK